VQIGSDLDETLQLPEVHGSADSVARYVYSAASRPARSPPRSRGSEPSSSNTIREALSRLAVLSFDVSLPDLHPGARQGRYQMLVQKWNQSFDGTAQDIRFEVLRGVTAVGHVADWGWGSGAPVAVPWSGAISTMSLGEEA
jgi:hypothetical protein